MGNKSHWEDVFAAKTEKEVSWYQSIPLTSIHLFEKCNLTKEANIIDVGGGDSHFIDFLVNNGYKNIFLLDISANAIKRAKDRLGEKAKHVNWIVSDILDFNPEIKFDFWHDRAAFHFLTSPDDIAKYVSLTGKVIRPGGRMSIGTFSDKGPKKCSGLEIKQYSEKQLSEQFSESFEAQECMTIDHNTPFDTVQNFTFCLFRRK